MCVIALFFYRRSCGQITFLSTQSYIQCWCEVKVAQLYPTLCNPMDYTVHGILQARILEWIAFPFSRASSQPREDLNPGRLHCRWILYQLSHKGSPRILEWVAYPFSNGSSRPRNRTGVFCIAGGFFTREVSGKPTVLVFRE